MRSAGLTRAWTPERASYGSRGFVWGLSSMALFTTATCAAASSPWTFGATGSFLPGYQFESYTTYGSIFNPGKSVTAASLPSSWGVSLSASRRISKSLSLRFESSYMPFHGDFQSLSWEQYSGGSGSPEPTGTLEARFVPTGLGLRFTREYPGKATRVFLDAAPLAVWSEHESNTTRTEGTSQTIIHQHRSAQSWQPGWTVGAGFGGPVGASLGYEIGVRYLMSWDPDTPDVHHTYYSTDVKGLSSFSIGLGITFSP